MGGSVEHAAPVAERWSVAMASGHKSVEDADELRKLAELNDGILSDQEFAAQKAKLLGCRSCACRQIT
jgi:hypothetical protein